MTTANGHTPDTPVLAPPGSPPVLWMRGPEAAWPERPDEDQPRRWRQRRQHVTSAVASHRGWLAAVPIVLVNAVAFAGQLAFLRTHLPWPLAGQVLVAVTLESVAVYLAWQAHLALAADDSALRLRLAAYSFALVIGVMNYSHWCAPGWRPTFAAVTFGLMSVSSPWLWSVHSRRVSRDALKDRGLIESHAVRLGATRLLWHPVRSVRVMRWAAWAGENDPARVIASWSPRHAAPQVSGGDSGGDRQDDTSDSDDDTPPPPPRPWQSMPPGRDKAVAVMAENPGWTVAEVAKAAGVHPRTVQRARDAKDRSAT